MRFSTARAASCSVRHSIDWSYRRPFSIKCSKECEVNLMIMHRGEQTLAIRALKSAAPYIRMYKGKTFVVKAGGGVFAGAGAARGRRGRGAGRHGGGGRGGGGH